MKIVKVEDPEMLASLSHEKYVLHGSDKPIEVVEPRQAKTRQKVPINNQLAVYASLCIAVPIIHAVIRHVDESSQMSWEIKKDERIHVWGRGVRFVTGYVHLLPKESFEIHEGGLFCLSRKPVKTVRAYRVEPQILHKLDDVILSPHLTSVLDATITDLQRRTV